MSEQKRGETWIIRDNTARDGGVLFDDPVEAARTRSRWDDMFPSEGPHSLAHLREVLPTDPSPEAVAGLVEAAREIRIAQHQLAKHWSESAEPKRNEMWRRLHAAGNALFDVLEQFPTPPPTPASEPVKAESEVVASNAEYDLVVTSPTPPRESAESVADRACDELGLIRDGKTGMVFRRVIRADRAASDALIADRDRAIRDLEKENAVLNGQLNMANEDYAMADQERKDLRAKLAEAKAAASGEGGKCPARFSVEEVAGYLCDLVDAMNRLADRRSDVAARKEAQ